MDRFASLLFYGLKSRGHDVRLLKPPPLIGRLRPSPTGLGKWIGYIDRFVFFRPQLWRAAKWADVVHICDQANAMYVPWLKEKLHLITCHDMHAIRSSLGETKEHRLGATGRTYQRWILSGLQQAQHVVCVSETTSEDFLRLAWVAKNRMSVVLNGLNYPYRHMREEEALCHLNQFGLWDFKPFFLHVGNNNWYKNKTGLLRIFAHIVRHDKHVNLLIAGTPLSSGMRTMASDLGISDRIREATKVTNEQLCAFYSTAEGLIFPSLAEGFGWPIIEAQACGCPVFTSNRMPMTEVGGSGAVYFDPEDESGAAEMIRNAIKKRDLLIESGYQNAVKYSADAMISGYIDTYHQVLN